MRANLMLALKVPQSILDATGMRVGDIVNIAAEGDTPARDWRTGLPVPIDEPFRIELAEGAD